MWMRIVVDELEVLVREVEDRSDAGIDLHLGKRTRLAAQLLASLFQVVVVQMGIAERMNKVPRFQVTNLSHHQRE